MTRQEIFEKTVQVVNDCIPETVGKTLTESK